MLIVGKCVNKCEQVLLHRSHRKCRDSFTIFHSDGCGLKLDELNPSAAYLNTRASPWPDVPCCRAIATQVSSLRGKVGILGCGVAPRRDGIMTFEIWYRRGKGREWLYRRFKVS